MPTLTSTNPYTQEINATFETLTDEQLLAKIEQSHEAFLNWKETSFDEKKALFHKLADVVDADVEYLAELQTKEM